MVKLLAAMPQYELYLWNQYRRVKYPRSLKVPDIEAAHKIALRVARVLIEVSEYWPTLSDQQRNDFVVEIVDEQGQTVLTVPFKEAE